MTSKKTKKTSPVYYYTIELITQPGNGYYDDLSDTKVVFIYDIKDNKPIQLAELTISMDSDSKEEVSSWLILEGYNEIDFKLVRL